MNYSPRLLKIAGATALLAVAGLVSAQAVPFQVPVSVPPNCNPAADGIGCYSPIHVGPAQTKQGSLGIGFIGRAPQAPLEVLDAAFAAGQSNGAGAFIGRSGNGGEFATGGNNPNPVARTPAPQGSVALGGISTGMNGVGVLGSASSSLGVNETYGGKFVGAIGTLARGSKFGIFATNKPGVWNMPDAFGASYVNGSLANYTDPDPRSTDKSFAGYFLGKVRISDTTANTSGAGAVIARNGNGVNAYSYNNDTIAVEGYTAGANAVAIQGLSDNKTTSYAGRFIGKVKVDAQGSAGYALETLGGPVVFDSNTTQDAMFGRVYSTINGGYTALGFGSSLPTDSTYAMTGDTNNTWINVPSSSLGTIRFMKGGATELLRIDPNGDARVSGDVYAKGVKLTSDARLKENITDLSDSLNKILKLRGVSFEWKADSSNAQNDGLIAQEVEQVIPEAVATDAKGMKSVDYQALTAHLIEAVKVQQVEIDSLKAEIKKLK